MSLLEGLLWLTLNVYHEARSEPEIGQMAIVHVTLNRSMERQLSVQEVVRQPYQFSWTFQKQSYFPNDPKAFFDCLQTVYKALQTSDITTGATHYLLDTISPEWADDYVFVSQFGSHKFYR